MLNQILNRLERLPSGRKEEENTQAMLIAEKVRKRSERSEEDRRHATRMNILKKQASFRVA